MTYFKLAVTVFLSGFLLSCASSHGPNPSSYDAFNSNDREAILATVDALFLALAAGDGDAFEALHAPDARAISVRPEKNGAVRYSSASAYAEALRDGSAPPVKEPYWDPIVLQRKSLAVVWAPYQVSVEEKLIHCGIDVINLSRHTDQEKDRWLIDSVSWTAEPSACEELWPHDKSTFRPDFN